MIINNNGETVEGTITAFKTEGFKIANTAHMMEILSKRLYTNPELAVCRELVCNAIDSHVSANNPQKVEVFMPNLCNDFRFVVKDYGTGLSEEEVMNLYTTYGMSSKQSSNDFIGCLGIGSKSPFAVTEEFTVVSRYHGKATTYHCYKQKGMPVCTKLSCVKTDEHDGMTVTVPFKDDTYKSFLRATENFWNGVDYSLVDVQGLDNPILFWESYIGSFEINYKELHIKKISYWDTKHYVRMGQVLYRVPQSFIDNDFESIMVVAEVPIGKLSIAANREFIEDSEENRVAYQKYVKSLADQYVDEVLLEDIQNIKTWSAYLKAYSKTNFRIFSKYQREVEEFGKKIGLNVYQNSVDTSAYFYGDRNKLKSKTDYYVNFNTRSKDFYCIVEDEKPVTHLRTLLKNFAGEDTDNTYFIPNKLRPNSARIPKHLWNVVYMSQLNRWTEYLKAQEKRRKKFEKKKQKRPSKNFTVREVSRLYDCFNRNLSAFDLSGEIVYVPIKGASFSEDCRKYQKIFNVMNKDLYAISESNLKKTMKYENVTFITAEDFMKEHPELYVDGLYNSYKKKLLSWLHETNSCKRGRGKWGKNYLNQYLTGSVTYNSIANRTYDLPDNYSEVFEPRTDSDRKLLRIIKEAIAYNNFVDTLTWLDFSGFVNAPEQIKKFIKRQYELSLNKVAKEVASD